MVIKNVSSENVEIPKELKEEAEILYELGVECYELEYLIYLRIKKEITLICE